jgi:hypothetical protein
MSIKATDLYISRTTQLMIQDIRRNRFLLSDMISDVMSDPILKDLYGAKELNKLNALVDKEIQVNLEYAIDVAKLPAIAIRVGGGTEDASKTGDPLADGYSAESITTNSLGGAFKNTNVVLGPITPESIDYLTGKVSFPSTISLASVFEDMVVFDEINKVEYPILVVTDNQTLFVEAGAKPNLNNMTIRTKDKNAIHTRRFFYSNEQVTFICAAVDPVEVIYLYQILLYQIGRHRISLFEGKNFRTGTINYTPIYKLAEEPNLIFARDITMSGTVEHSYISSTTAPIAGTAHDVRIGDMTSPQSLQIDGSTRGWSGEGDP